MTLRIAKSDITGPREQTVKRTTFIKFAVLGGFVLAITGSLDTVGRLGANVRSRGYSELSNGRGGTNVEGVVYTAGVASHVLLAVREFRVDLTHHENHVAGGDLLHLFIGRPIPLDVAIRLHEVLHGGRESGWESTWRFLGTNPAPFLG